MLLGMVSWRTLSLLTMKGALDVFFFQERCRIALLRDLRSVLRANRF